MKEQSTDVESMIANPIYVGMGPFPKLVEDDLYIAAAKLMIAEHGAEVFLRTMIGALRASFDAQVEEE